MTAGRDQAAWLELRAAGVSFGRVDVLRDVTLSISPGEFIAVVGANGSGKTTLLRLLHGLLEHRGEREVTVPPPVQAMVFQRPFMLNLSVLNNLRLALWLAGHGRAARWSRGPDGAISSSRRSAPGASDSRSLALAALDRVGLTALQHRPARVLSGGEQQRLALARAWALRPDLLFLDEPTANLDPTAKKEVEALLEGFAGEGMTLVMSTHNLGQAKRLATRVVYVENGQIKADLPSAVFFAGGEHGAANLFLRGELPWTPF